MPHVIIEYSYDLGTELQITSMLNAIHQTVITSGLFEPANVKTRAIAASHYRVGAGNGKFIHVQMRIHAGRNEPTKQMLSESVLQTLRSLELSVNVITAEVVDMDRASYAKFSI